MAGKQLSALTELAATPADDDELYIRDVSEAAADESKRVRKDRIARAFGAGWTANKFLKGAGVGSDPTEIDTLAIVIYATEQLQWSNDTARNPACTTSYEKRKEIKIGSAKGNGIRIKFTMASINAGLTAYGQVYRNGVAIGTERSQTSTSGVVYSEDFDCSAWANNDLIQIYGKGSSAGWFHPYSNFRFYYDLLNPTNQDP